jgi:hypothetical protein
MALEESSFTDNLPLLRRVFSILGRTERRRLMDALAGRAGGGARGYVLARDAMAVWPRHQARILDLLDAGAPK